MPVNAISFRAASKLITLAIARDPVFTKDRKSSTSPISGARIETLISEHPAANSELQRFPGFARGPIIANVREQLHQLNEVGHLADFIRASKNRFQQIVSQALFLPEINEVNDITGDAGFVQTLDFIEAIGHAYGDDINSLFELTPFQIEEGLTHYSANNELNALEEELLNRTELIPLLIDLLEKHSKEELNIVLETGLAINTAQNHLNEITDILVGQHGLTDSNDSQAKIV